MPSSYFAGPRPRVFGHRGAAGEAPENTIPSFERALACGADILELDVHATRDGRIVVMHDPTLDRTTSGSGRVCEHSWRDLQKLDAGFHFSVDGHIFPFRGVGVTVPALADVFHRFPQACFNIEVKQAVPPIAGDVVRLVGDSGCQDRVLLAAEEAHIMEQIRAEAGDRIATGFSAAEVAEFIGKLHLRELADYRPAGRALQIPAAFDGIDLVTSDSVRAARGLGIEVHVWTINDRDEMDRLLDLGVDGIMSDLPALARTAVDAYRRKKEAPPTAGD